MAETEEYLLMSLPQLLQEGSEGQVSNLMTIGDVQSNGQKVRT